MAEGGGAGITTMPVLQSLAQARHRWGEHAADAIWDAASVKIVLGGLAKMRDLDDVAYVRFASVYRNFREAKDFHDVLGELRGEGDG